MAADPNDLYDEADRLKSEGNLQEAAGKLLEAIAVDESFTLGHSALAVVLQKLGQHGEAIQHAQRVCELAPDDPFSFTALSVTYQRAYAGTGDTSYIQLAEDAMARSRMMQG